MLHVVVTTSFSQTLVERPNIIMLMADDLGWGDVGFNGNDTVKTPHLDRMAAEGVKFDRFYAVAPICSPTRGSCLTGRHPYRYGIYAAHTAGLRTGEVTIAEELKEQGYATGFFGKWHLGHLAPEPARQKGYYSPPWWHGFDHTFATQSAVPTWNPSITPPNWNNWGNTAGDPWNGKYYLNGEQVPDTLMGDDSRVIMDRVLPFVREQVGQGSPFYACVWFHAPHEPVVSGPEYRQLYAGLEEDQQHLYGCITAMDEQIGRLVDELERLGVAENTIIFFCSDNGPDRNYTKRGIASAGPFRGSKHTMYEGGLRVPALAYSPRMFVQGKVVGNVVSTDDYFPTVMELVGDRAVSGNDRPMDGKSFKSLLTEREAGPWANEVHAGYMRLYQQSNGIALVKGQYKLVQPVKSGEYELYDLKNDPGETTNLLSALPEVVNELLQELKEWEQSWRHSNEGGDYPY